MSRPVKTVLKLALPVIVACGCASAPPPAPRASTVSTTELTDAKMAVPDAPRVGKAQSSGPVHEDELGVEKGAPRRRVDRRPGGGFSGYK